jgi:hypothetical protein
MTGWAVVSGLPWLPFWADDRTRTQRKNSLILIPGEGL